MWVRRVGSAHSVPTPSSYVVPGVTSMAKKLLNLLTA